MVLELPKDLEKRIVTCAAYGYMKSYDMTPTDYHLVEVSGEGYSYQEAQSALMNRMITEHMMAVTDLRPVAISPYRELARYHLLGTGIIPKHLFVQNDSENKKQADGEQ